MTAPLSDEDITGRVKDWQRRSHVPFGYFLILGLPLAADLLRIPVPDAVLWPATLVIFAAALGARSLVLLRRPDPAAGVDTSMFRQRLAEVGASTRRRNILAMSISLAGMLWTVAQAPTPVKRMVMAAIVGLLYGVGTAAFLLNIRIGLAPKGRVFRDEELTSALRGQAARWGGLVVLTAVLVAFPATVLRPDCAPVAMSVLVWTACAAPLLIFAWLEHRIERDV